MLKPRPTIDFRADSTRFSALQRAEIAESDQSLQSVGFALVSVLFNEPKLLKLVVYERNRCSLKVSVLFNEPKLLKRSRCWLTPSRSRCFSALQRAEIAEIRSSTETTCRASPVSVLFNEPKLLKSEALARCVWALAVSVLFNEPKLLKCIMGLASIPTSLSFSALQRAEIAENNRRRRDLRGVGVFQCSSTSRNC